MKTRTEITFEMDRLIVVKRSRKSELCSECSRPLDTNNADDATLVNSLLETLKERRDENYRDD